MFTFAREPSSGRLTPVAGGCINETSAFGCAVGRRLPGGMLAISPDGRSVYTGAIAALGRDPATGALSQRPGPDGCIADQDTAGDCARGRALFGILNPVVSPDGKNLYAAASPGGVEAGSVATLVRDPASGVLSQPGEQTSCFRRPVGVGETEPIPPGQHPRGPCLPALGLHNARGIAISPDGRDVYVSTSSNLYNGTAPFITEGLFHFNRNTQSGQLALSQGPDGCIGKSTERACATPKPVPDLTDAALVVDPAGRRVYAAGRAGVSIFQRDPDTGALDQARGPTGCVRIPKDGFTLGCRLGRAMLKAKGIAVSPDGQNVYLAALERDGAIAVLTRPVVSISGRTARLGRGRHVRIAVRCFGESRPCTGKLSLRTARKPPTRGTRRPRRLALGSGRLTIPAGATRIVRVKLSRRAATLTRRRTSLPVTATAAATTNGHSHTATRRLPLRTDAPRHDEP